MNSLKSVTVWSSSASLFFYATSLMKVVKEVFMTRFSVMWILTFLLFLICLLMKSNCFCSEERLALINSHFLELRIAIFAFSSSIYSLFFLASICSLSFSWCYMNFLSGWSRVKLLASTLLILMWSTREPPRSCITLSWRLTILVLKSSKNPSISRGLMTMFSI